MRHYIFMSEKIRGHLVNTNDFASLLWILDMSRQNGVVHVELPSAQRTEKGEPWRARLDLVERYVVACHVQSQVDGRRLFSDGEAMRWLARWGQRELAWSLEVFTLHQTTPHPAPAGLLPPPRPVAPPNGPRNRRICRPRRAMVLPLAIARNRQVS